MFRFKRPEQLNTQLQQASEQVGENIIPPSLGAEVEGVLDLPEHELKSRFPKRYEMYEKLVKTRRKGNVESAQEERQEMVKWFQMLNNIDQYIFSHHKQESKRTLREKQINVFEDLREFLEQGNTEGYIKLPTGVGKTVIFIEFIEALSQKTLIVVPTKILIRQTGEKMEQFAPDVEVGKIYAQSKEHGRQVTVTTYASFVKLVENGKINPDDFDCLILDEAHEALSERRSETVKRFTKALKLGFTATPAYAEDKNVGRLLNTEIHKMSIREAVEGGMASPFSVVVAKANIDLSRVKVTASGEYDEEDLARAINIEGRNKAAVRLYTETFKDQKAVLYASGIKHAEAMASLFKEAGIAAEMISGEMLDSQQKIILERYKNGEIMVLCNADLLTRGFDEPSASVCLNLRPTLSAVLAEQRGGRVLRLDPDNPNKVAFIIEFLDENSNFRNIPVTFAEIADGAIIMKTGGSAIEGLDEIINAAIKKSKTLKIEGLEITIDAREVMKIVTELKDKKYQPAPEGWMTAHAVGVILKRADNFIVFKANTCRKEHPEWFKDYLDVSGHINEHYAPELTNFLIESLKIETAPKGWMAYEDLMEKLNMSLITVSRKTAPYRKTNPEWFKEYRSAGDKILVHVAPELTNKLIAEVGTREVAPPGWMTKEALANLLDENKITVGSWAKKYKAEHPEWFGNYMDSKKRVFEHYSPQLVEVLRKEFQEFKELKAPEPGWMTRREVRLSSDKTVGEINKLFVYYKATNPEGFRKFLHPVTRKPEEYLSPGVIEAILSVKIEEKAPLVPEGWMPKYTIASLLGHPTPSRVVKIAEPYRAEHPEWFGNYRNKKNKVTEYFSPELVGIIIQQLRQE